MISESLFYQGDYDTLGQRDSCANYWVMDNFVGS